MAIALADDLRTRAISDTQAYFRDRTADLDGAWFEPEFTFWTTP